LFQKCKTFGDYLIVAIDSDKRVRELKDRCINKAKDRKKMLEAIRYVDKVIVFNDLLGLIDKIKPDVLVKGADYKLWDIVGADHVPIVKRVKIKRGYSTTKLIEKIYEDCNCRR
jgi:D-beta-D-heptose 7-phosphate kinase/D-beta-D-heptose 1-phosphate adenosyltransferase